MKNFNGRMEKVVIVDSERSAIVVRARRICKSLMKAGYDVEILTWDRTGERDKIEYMEGCKIHNFRLKFPNLKIYGIIPFYPIWWIYVFLYLMKSRIHVIHPLNLYNLIPTIPIKLFKKKKIIYDLTDTVSISVRWPRLIRRILTYLENFSLRFLDGIIIVDECRKKNIDTRKIERIAIVMNSPEDLFDDINIEKNYNKREFIIYYGGWIVESRGIKHIIDAIKNIDDVRLIIAGAGPDIENFKPFFYSQYNIEFKGLIDNIESLKLTKQADAVFAFYDPKIPINKLASPNKVFEAMMCGTPIIANSEALPVREIITKEKCGVLEGYDNSGGLKRVIKWLKDHPEERKKMGENGRKAFRKKYNWEIMERRLLNLYKEVLNECG